MGSILTLIDYSITKCYWGGQLRLKCLLGHKPYNLNEVYETLPEKAVLLNIRIMYEMMSTGNGIVFIIHLSLPP